MPAHERAKRMAHQATAEKDSRQRRGPMQRDALVPAKANRDNDFDELQARVSAGAQRVRSRLLAARRVVDSARLCARAEAAAPETPYQAYRRAQKLTVLANPSD